MDLKLAVRLLWRRPAFTLTAVLTLAVGMGVNTVAFTVVNGMLFKGSARSVGDDVGRIQTTPGGDETGYASLAEYQRFADATRGAVDLAAEGRSAVAWQHDGVTETAWVLFVSANYFPQVTARPIAGRLDVARGDGSLPSVVIGERFWRRKLNAASLAGLELRLNGAAVGVAGVVPESFTGPAGIYSPDVWLPLDDLTVFRGAAALQNPDDRWLFLFGRVRPGIETAEVDGRVQAAAAAMARDWPDTHGQRGARFRLRNDSNTEVRGLRTAAAIGMGIIGLVLLLACFNVANLLLARAVERQREIAIRAAIGAGTLRLVRLVVAEGLVISVLAGTAALVIAWWTQALVGSFAIPIDQPQHIDLTPDARVAGFVAMLVVIAGVLPGLWPAVAAARVDVARVLVQGGGAVGGRPSRMRQWLVGAQIAGSTAFLAIAALFAQSYGTLSRVEMGFDSDRLVIAEFAPSSHGYDAARAGRYADALHARLRTLPGVADVAIAHRAPFFIGYEVRTPVSSAAAACEPAECPQHATMAVGPGYFRTLGVPMAAGREFTQNSSAEVVINHPLAALHWPDGRGVGETLRIGERGQSATVVGITAKTKTRGLDRERPTLYVPLGSSHYEGGLTVIVRTAVPPETLVRPFIETAQASDPNVSMTSVKTMRDRMAVQLWPFRTASWLFSICGALALVLGTVGLAAVVIHAVNRRLREFGVRVSMGATPRDLVADVLKSSGRLLAPGLIAGSLVAAVAAQLVQAAFVGVNVLNPLTYLAVVLIECATVVVACVGPALRASRVDPVVALRAE
jgi:predicted permease